MMSREDAACQGPAAAAGMLVTGFNPVAALPDPVRVHDRARQNLSLVPRVQAVAAANTHLVGRLGSGQAWAVQRRGRELRGLLRGGVGWSLLLHPRLEALQSADNCHSAGRTERGSHAGANHTFASQLTNPTRRLPNYCHSKPAPDLHVPGQKPLQWLAALGASIQLRQEQPANLQMPKGRSAGLRQLLN